LSAGAPDCRPAATHVSADTLAPYIIRVNTVHPVGVNTPMIVNDAMAEFLAWILSGIIANS